MHIPKTQDDLTSFNTKSDNSFNYRII